MLGLEYFYGWELAGGPPSKDRCRIDTGARSAYKSLIL
jgi:hypothetical protein